jgi:hypothetical protein
MAKVKDRTGQKFGKLTAIKFVKTNYKGHAIWLFSCDCGGEKEVEANRVACGNTTSCGCRLLEGQYDTIENMAFRQHKQNSKYRKYEWFLTLEEYLKIARTPCAYCGKFSTRKNYATGATLNLNSVDRINNEPYYRVENCQSVCFAHQRLKSSFSHEDFLNNCFEIVNFLGRQNEISR